MNAERWRRSKEIYSSALDLPAGQRRGAIALECKGDTDLELEVLRLLEVSSGDDFLENASSFIGEILPGSDDPSFEVGAVLCQRFVIRRFIARGGMGQVFEAHDSVLKDTVALKAIRPEIADADAANRLFKREVQRTRTIASGNVCRVYDLFTHEQAGRQPVLFLTMELLAGETLGERLRRRGPMKSDEAMPIIRGIAEGLRAAHKESIVHGDMKLSNVMLVRCENGELAAKITDFGLCVRAAGDEEPAIMAGGTPAYMAPEQIAGAAPSVASDVYAFALVVIQMLGGPAAGSKDAAEVLRHCGLPRCWKRTIQRCLLVDPRERPARSGQVADELAASRGYTRRYVLAGVLVGGSLAGAVPYVRRLSWRPAAQPALPSIAVLCFRNTSSDQAYFSEAITEELTRALAGSERLHVIGRDTAERFHESKLAPVEIARTMGVKYLASGAITRARGQVGIDVRLVDGSNGRQVWADSYNSDERQVFRLRDRIASKIAAQLGVPPESFPLPLAPVPVNLEAHDLYWAGRALWRTRSDSGIQRAAELFQQAIDSKPDFALAYSGLADAYAVIAERSLRPPAYMLAEARRCAGKAVALDQNLPQAHVSLGHISTLYDRNFRAAELEFQTALSLDPRSAAANQWYGYMLMKVRRFDESHHHALKALETEPLSIPANANLAVQSYYAGRYDECLAQTRKVLGLDSSLFWHHLIAALVFARTALKSEALREMELVPEADRDHSLTIRTRAELAALFGEYDKAREYAEVLLEMRRTRGVPASWVAAAMAASRQDDRAFEWLERSYAEYDAFLSLLDIYPAFETIRSDRRYRPLLQKLGLTG